MSFAPEAVASAITTIRYWWEAIPPAQRQAAYSMTEIDCPLPGHTGVIGEALRHLGWLQLPKSKNRKWAPPAQSLPVKDDVAFLRGRMKALEAQLATSQKNEINEEAIRRKIIGLRDAMGSADVPEWVLVARVGKQSSPGVPTLFMSDLHWDEVVKPEQINGVNKYNRAIAHERMHTLVDTAISLLQRLSPKMEYPGVVVPLGGDMISGNIHDELTATNEFNTMPTIVDLYSVLRGVIAKLADTFGQVYLPCVTGNHGRDTRKIWSKDRHATSFDWLLYTFLEKHFEGDKRIRFNIPEGPDAHYSIFGYRYLLTHGDQFRGGDGMVGSLGPIIRGDHKKRSRNTQIDMGYDTMLLGHWHSYMHLTRLIVNGSLKGYDEYAYNSNFGFEPPQQALWLTHPKHGITYRMPVFVGEERKIKAPEWVSWRKAV